MDIIEEAERKADELGRPCIIPVARRFRGCEDPAGLYFSLKRSGEPSFLLESAERPGESARYSVIGLNPLLHIKLRGAEVKISGKGEFPALARERASGGKNVLDAVRRTVMLDEIKVPAESMRYAVGAFGYLCYEHALSRPEVFVRGPVCPEAEFIVPGTVVLFDHVEGTTTHIHSIPFFDGSGTGSPENLVSCSAPLNFSLDGVNSAVTSNISKGKFEEMVKRAKDYIRRGDIIQAVLSRRLEISPAPPEDVFYARLRRINPSPYMFFFDFPGRSIIGSSPEMLVRVEGSRAVIRPIAGTRRLEGPDFDRVARELSEDEKERAEHVMLVDLGRNDLGKVCAFGTVKVEDFMSIERYSHVIHMVSTVAGKLRSGMSGIDALEATFPAGTVTGAPKVRAMEIIDELEKCRRGVYAGAVGCIGYGGDLDMAIAIRTMVVENGIGSVQVGAGIVADSVPWKEYYETENKARGLLEAAGCI
ncbi:MAG: anthranilate synthase component I family protein [Candidatus Hadarchaeales archaeon]